MVFCGDPDGISLHSTGGWNVSSEKERKSKGCGWSFLSADHPDEQQQVSQDTQTYIADALHSMSLQDRDKIYHEIHGVDELIEETPVLLRQSFLELQTALQRLVDDPVTFKSKSLNCESFVRAQQQDFNYVHSNFHYKAFLRAERFNATDAAIRMIRFFDTKAKCFGADNLCQDITQDIMTPGDMESFARGFNQVLPGRDRSGRCIWLNLPHLTHFESPESLGRQYMYQTWSIAQDEETQRKGVALICFESGDHERPPLDMSLVAVAAQEFMSCPVKYVVMHHCFSDERFKFIVQMGLKLLHRDLRARTKLHFGATMECLYELMGFGIPQEALPFNLHGELKLKHHLDWIAMRAHQERWIREGKLKPMSQIKGEESHCLYHSQQCVVVVPAQCDILLGRGSRISSHQGNIKLHHLVDELVPEYEARRRSEKTTLTQQLVQRVKDEIGARFLKQDDASGIWLVTDDETARLKVSHLFRTRRDIVMEELARKKKDEDGALEGMLADEATSGSVQHASKRARFAGFLRRITPECQGSQG